MDTWDLPGKRGLSLGPLVFTRSSLHGILRENGAAVGSPAIHKHNMHIYIYIHMIRMRPPPLPPSMVHPLIQSGCGYTYGFIPPCGVVVVVVMFSSTSLGVVLVLVMVSSTPCGAAVVDNGSIHPLWCGCGAGNGGGNG